MNADRAAEWSAIAGIAGAVAAIAGVVVAVLAYLIGRHARDASRTSAVASKDAAAAADAMLKIEQSRRYGELAPQLSVALTAYSPDEANDLLRLTLTLTGPIELPMLDSVEIRIRDDYPHAAGIAGGPTEEELASVIWGPLRFRPHVDDADSLGRATPGVPAVKGTPIVRILEPSLSPRWTDLRSWRQRYRTSPLQLSVICRFGTYTWTHVIDLDLPATVADRPEI
ncbi:hypothetical protein Q5425_02900 [Amycolatopsis sp. A133]|uniref:hypothetical protein n=1 Tax=Amycolatopsis sp. A133 TaxID=3064472 RepID=UPI0027EF41A5|nr:hypothetical protein [Amycolatopsis sp. A133]MDQ7802664.1 hypothetical protein [Amycolatopsis sp. A133]